MSKEIVNIKLSNLLYFSEKGFLDTDLAHVIQYNT